MSENKTFKVLQQQKKKKKRGIMSEQYHTHMNCEAGVDAGDTKAEQVIGGAPSCVQQEGGEGRTDTQRTAGNR